MATAIRCSSCKGTFSSSEDYQNHLPCGGSSMVGGAGDLGYFRQGSEEADGTGRN